MKDLSYDILLTFFTSLVLGLYIIPRIVLISKRKRLFDKIDARKEAKPPTPRLGGLAFFPVSLFAFNFILGVKYVSDNALPNSVESSLLITFMFLIAGMVLIFLLGLSDDLVEVGYKTKFASQIFSALMIIFAGLSITDLQNILFINEINPTVGAVLTVIIIVFCLNAFNLIDGVNGLCSGLSLIALGALGGWYWYAGNLVYAMLAFSMLGVLLAFFFYNMIGKRLQVFMGDTGALTLGFLIAFLALQFNTIDQNINGDTYEPINKLALVIGLLFIPLFDTIRVFVGRLSKGLSPFHPDRTHIHHKLLTIGLSHTQTTFALLLTQIGYLGLNIVLSQILKLDNNLTLGIDVILAIGLVYMINNKINKRINIQKTK